MARIDPKNDEFGMMENIYRGVRPAIGEISTAKPEKNAEVEPAVGSSLPEAETPESAETIRHHRPVSTR
jgi:hypothetical protein